MVETYLNLSDDSNLGIEIARLGRFKRRDEIYLWGERYEILRIYQNKIEIQQLGEDACVISDFVPVDIFLRNVRKARQNIHDYRERRRPDSQIVRVRSHRRRR